MDNMQWKFQFHHVCFLSKHRGIVWGCFPTLYSINRHQIVNILRVCLFRKSQFFPGFLAEFRVTCSEPGISCRKKEILIIVKKTTEFQLRIERNISEFRVGRCRTQKGFRMFSVAWHKLEFRDIFLSLSEFWIGNKMSENNPLCSGINAP